MCLYRWRGRNIFQDYMLFVSDLILFFPPAHKTHRIETVSDGKKKTVSQLLKNEWLFRIEAKDVNILSAVQILFQSGIQWFHGSGKRSRNIKGSALK